MYKDVNIKIKNNVYIFIKRELLKGQRQQEFPLLLNKQNKTKNIKM